MKKIFSFIVFLIVLVGSAYFLVPKYLPDSKIAEVVESIVLNSNNRKNG